MYPLRGLVNKVGRFGVRKFGEVHTQPFVNGALVLPDERLARDSAAFVRLVGAPFGVTLMTKEGHPQGLNIGTPAKRGWPSPFLGGTVVGFPVFFVVVMLEVRIDSVEHCEESSHGRTPSRHGKLFGYQVTNSKSDCDRLHQPWAVFERNTLGGTRFGVTQENVFLLYFCSRYTSDQQPVVKTFHRRK